MPRHPLGLPFLSAATLLVVGGFALPASASGGFFVTYDSKVDKGEVELMLMNDITAPSERRRKDDGFGDYLSHMVELEYGITDQLATEFMLEGYQDLKTGEKAFSGFRWENRYRLFKDSVPLNPMLYAEYEDLDPKTRYKMEVSGWTRPPYEESGAEPDRERILETRVVLHQPVGGVDAAFNWINESDLGSGVTAFGYAAGIKWTARPAGRGHVASTGAHGAGLATPQGETTTHTPGDLENAGSPDRPGQDHASCSHGISASNVAATLSPEHEEHEHRAGQVDLGLEMYGGLGDTRAFALQPDRQEHYLGPIFNYHMAGGWMLHGQLAVGLTPESDNLVRLNAGYEF